MAIKQLNTTISQSPEGKSIAKIREIRGNSLVWNQLVPFDGWVSSSATKTINGDEITVTKIANVGTGSGLLRYSNKVIAGHKYLYSSELMTTESVEVSVWLGMNVLGKRIFSGAALTAWTKYVSIIEAPADVPDNDFFVIYIRTATGENTLSVKVKNVQVFDLTLMFGAGNEPSTVEEFEAMFPNSYYPYNEGTLINVGGKVILNWNQLLSVTGGTLACATRSITNDNIITLTKSSTTCGVGGMLKYTNFTISPSHQYYISANVLDVSGSSFVIHFGTNLVISDNTALVWEIGESGKKSMIISPVINSNELDFRIGSYSSAIGVYAKFKDILCVDLTQAFGAGYEPKTPEEFELLLSESYYPYNAGTNSTYSFSPCIETVGFNQWDEEWESGVINGTTGNNENNDGYFRSKNYIPVIQGAAYCLTRPRETGHTNGYVYCYDGNKNYLGVNTIIGLSSTVNTLSLPSGVSYIKFAIAYPSYANNVCINFFDASKNGTYEPYKKSTFPLNISTLTGKLNGEGESVVICSDGLKSAGSAYDYGIIENGYLTKIVKVIGEVDMGDMTWTKSSDQLPVYYFYSSLVDKKAGVNLLCSRYTTRDITGLTGTHPDKIIAGSSSSGTVYVSDTTYANGDAAAFTTAMTDAHIIYELTTPQTYVLDTPIYMGYETGTERIVPSNILQAPLIADIDYFSDAIKHIEFDSEKHCIRDERILGIDSEPTESSNNIITSGGVYDAIRNKKPLYTKTYTYKCKDATEAEAYIYFMNITPTSNEWATPWTVHYTLTVDCDISEDVNAKYCHGDYDVFIGCAGSNYYYHIFNKFYSSSYYPIYYHKLIYHGSEAKYNSYRESHPAKAGVRVLSAWGSNTRTRKYTIKVYDYKNCVISFPDNIENHTTAYSSTYNNVVDFNATSIGLQETGDANTANYYNYEYYVGYRIHGTDTPLYRYKFIGFDDRNRIVPINITNQTDSTIVNKTACSVPMTVSNGLALYITTTAITDASTAVATGTIYRDTSVVSGILQYNLSESVGRSSNSTTSRDIYLVGTYDVNTDEFTLDASSYTSFYKVVAILQSESDYYANFTNGKYYWYLGQCPTSDNVFNFQQHHPLFYFNGTKLIEVKSKAISEKEDKSNKVTSLTSSSTNTQYPSAKAVYDHINTQLTSVLKYKGTIGTGGTVTSLPATHSVGDVYVVSTAGTYAEKACEVGDYIICKTAGTSANNAHWDVINGENQVENKSASLAAAGSSSTLATVDGTNITVTTPSTWTGVAKTGTITKVGNTSSGAVTVSSSNNTASFGSAVTVGSVGGVDLKFTMPANPNSNTTYTFAEGSTDGAFSVTPSGGSASSINVHGVVKTSGNQTITGVKTFTNVSDLRFSAAANDKFVSSNNSYITASPFNWELWHDHFAFLRVHTVENVEHTTDGTNWTTSSVDVVPLFIHRESNSVVILSPSDQGFRFTLYSSSFHACQVLWISLGVNYSSPFSAFDLIIEYSTDGSSWTTWYQNNITSYQIAYFLRLGSLASNQTRIRFTFIKTTNLTTGYVSLNSLCGLTTRKGNQGLGKENQFPYNWDKDANVFPFVATQDLGTTSVPWNNVYAKQFIKKGGTSSQFLKADGSVDSNTYLKLDPGAAEQTIKSHISTLDKGIINLYRDTGDHYTFLGFSNGSTEKYLGGIGFKSQADHELYLKTASSTNTPSTNYYKIWNENNHPAPGVTAGTAGSSTASSGSTLDVPYVTVNAAGHVTGYGTHTHTISGFSTTDTKNTAGSTDSSSKLFIIGATSQAANPQTYSQDTAYVGTDGHLYSNSKQVVNLSDTQALTNKTYNGYTLAGACAKAVVTTVDTSASLPTSNAVKTFVEGKGYVTTDTKNTAGSTDTSSKIFLIGATSQAANPQTYSDNEVYATSGVLTTRSVQVGGTAATMQYNSTDNSIEFVFG